MSHDLWKLHQFPASFSYLKSFLTNMLDITWITRPFFLRCNSFWSCSNRPTLLEPYLQGSTTSQWGVHHQILERWGASTPQNFFVRLAKTSDLWNLMKPRTILATAWREVWKAPLGIFKKPSGKAFDNQNGSDPISSVGLAWNHLPGSLDHGWSCVWNWLGARLTIQFVLLHWIKICDSYENFETKAERDLTRMKSIPATLQLSTCGHKGT